MSNELIDAVKSGKSGKEIQKIIDSGKVDINAVGDKGRTALMWAVVKGDYNIAKLLLNNDASTSGVDDYGMDALKLAQRAGNRDLFGLIEERDTNKGSMEEDGYEGTDVSEFLSAIKKGNYEKVTEMINNDPAIVNQTDGRGNTPLMYAARYGLNGVARQLVDYRRVDKNKTNDGGMTALDYAIKYKHEDLILTLGGQKALDKYISEVDEKDRKIDPDLNKKIEEGQDEEEEGEFFSELIPLIKKDDFSKAVELLKTDPDLANKTDSMGNTPLMYAARYGANGIAKWLINQYGVSRYTTNGKGTSALDFAIKYDHELLIQTIADRRQLAEYEASKKSNKVNEQTYGVNKMNNQVKAVVEKIVGNMVKEGKVYNKNEFKKISNKILVEMHKYLNETVGKKEWHKILNLAIAPILYKNISEKFEAIKQVSSYNSFLDESIEKLELINRKLMNERAYTNLVLKNKLNAILALENFVNSNVKYKYDEKGNVRSDYKNMINESIKRVINEGNSKKSIANILISLKESCFYKFRNVKSVNENKVISKENVSVINENVNNIGSESRVKESYIVLE